MNNKSLWLGIGLLGLLGWSTGAFGRSLDHAPDDDFVDPQAGLPAVPLSDPGTFPAAVDFGGTQPYYGDTAVVDLSAGDWGPTIDYGAGFDPLTGLGVTDMSNNAAQSTQQTLLSLTRGERNNNPGNIRKSGVNWLGLAPNQNDIFATFVSPEYGIRAMGLLLRGYEAKGYNTIRKIVSRYAPSTENDTNAYINAVSARMNGVSPDQALDLSNAGILASLINAMIVQENGRNIYADAGTVGSAISMIA